MSITRRARSAPITGVALPRNLSASAGLCGNPRPWFAGQLLAHHFTLPAQLRALAWQHQRAVYTAMMDCAWQTLHTFSQNHKQLRGNPGAVAVLHTHSRRLDFHPHVHVAMPAGALDADKRLWRSLRASAKWGGYLFNHKVPAKVFAAKLLDALRQEGLVLPPDLPKK